MSVECTCSVESRLIPLKSPDTLSLADIIPIEGVESAVNLGGEFGLGEGLRPVKNPAAPLRNRLSNVLPALPFLLSDSESRGDRRYIDAEKFAFALVFAARVFAVGEYDPFSDGPVVSDAESTGDAAGADDAESLSFG